MATVEGAESGLESNKLCLWKVIYPLIYGIIVELIVLLVDKNK